ncbi:tRNA (adenosine(37)-N6)-threonylcarbamoyltransferase complex transferase subunit TsaD [Oscillospiraceae bacterium LTW-04]|nr:tRNA (adenosine(37)-N6)-threonylcarbamoyltransferase complex transferase subunit TsaD [Oscillospiraceae bacterium MB24-C1]
MKILAIESSCDETAAAVVENGRSVLSSVIHTQIAEHRLYGGVVPEIASRRHIEKIDAVVSQAFSQAGLSVCDVDAIAVTAGPGLIGALLVGVNFAKGLAFATGKPLIPVHHIRGHIAANYIASPQLKPPFLCLVASGGHSVIIDVRDYTDLKVLGRSRDDAAGEAFDKAARSMGLGYPGGVALDAQARLGDENKYRFPKPHVEGAPLDMSFSGVKTSVVNLLHNAQQKGEILDMPSLCASFEKTVCDALCSRLFLAAEQTGAKNISVAGGVSANTRLRAQLINTAAERGLNLYMPPLSLTGDNAAMIGAQAYFEFLAGHVAGAALNAVATLSVENGSPESFMV